MQQFLTERTKKFQGVAPDEIFAYRWACLTASWPEALVDAVIAWKELEQLAPAWYWLMIERYAEAME